MTVRVRRGDVVVVELDPTRGSEQRGTGPCLVVQNDVGNEKAPTTIVAPFTTSFGDDRYPFEVFVPSADSPLREDSVALCNQLRTVAIDQRILENVGSVPRETLEDLDTALKYSLGLIDV